MKYHSTRGQVKGLTFQQMLLSGYASDGGMLLPESVPAISTETLHKWSGLVYPQLAFEVASLFIDREEIPEGDLKDILSKAFSTFSVPEVVPITRLAGGLIIVELYHGQSLAFKDLAMSCMGQFYRYFLRKNNQRITLVVATSGDTGSSAIEAVRGMTLVDILVILPRGRITDIQERMMTAVIEDNVHVMRADGTSDDIDITVRELFADAAFVATHKVASPSSLNFARILIQMVHFFYTYLKLCPQADQEVELVLPTGGAGNLAAGTLARLMGLRVRLVCAVNHNNILSRMMDNGQCELGQIDATLAPAMDIQFSYNLERVWFLCSGEDGTAVTEIMAQVGQNKVRIPRTILDKMKSWLSVYTVSGDDEIKASILRCWKESEYVVCPHTAVALAYFYHRRDTRSLTLPEKEQLHAIFSTASPLKFPEAIQASGIPAPTSDRIKRILNAPVRYSDLEKDDDWITMVRTKIEEISNKVVENQSQKCQN